MRKLLTIGILLMILSMLNNVSAQRFLERAGTPDIQTETVVAIETATTTANNVRRQINLDDGVRVISEGRQIMRNNSENMESLNIGNWIRFEWRVPTGGCPGGISYQWQQSSDGQTWINAPGVNTERIYTTPPITADTYFRRLATDDCGVTFSTTSVRITISRTVWATRNVDMPGTFVANPQDPGRLYQWNRRQSWAITGDITGWNSMGARGTAWERANDPCPEGWRVPTTEELESLGVGRWDENWQNTGVRGKIFGTAPNQIFLPAAGWREIDGTPRGVGVFGYYWSNTMWQNSARHLSFGSTYAHAGVFSSRPASGFSVRCVAE